MKIAIKETISKEVDIKIPSFYKHPLYNSYYALLSTERLVVIYTAGISSISISEPVDHYIQDILKSKEIGEEEFYEAFQKVYVSISEYAKEAAI